MDLSHQSPSDRTQSAMWGGPFVLGLIVTLLGIFAFIAAGVTSLASILVFGALIFVGGILEIIYAFRARKEHHFLLPFLSGLLALAVGAMFVARPLAGLAAVSLLLAGYFLASGLFRGITSLVDRYQNWGWDLFYGIVTVILGVVIVSNWPISALWVVGALVGAELVVRGSAVMGASMALRRGMRAETPAAAR